MQDALLNKDNDLSFKNGDIEVGISVQQHQRMLLICPKGSFKKNPEVGVGVLNYLEDENAADLFSEIKTQLSGDGMEIESIDISGGNLKIDAHY